MVAELAYKAAELAWTSNRESAESRTMGDRETMLEFKEEREIDSEYIEMEENNEMQEYSEYKQTVRFCSETNDMKVHMIKMNIKLPNPTAFDGRNP
eukprot:4767219-Amphidinium_carterae.1